MAWSPLRRDPSRWVGKGLPLRVERMMTEGVVIEPIDADSVITEDFETFDVLADPEVREGIKTYSNWPTIPQCYIDGEFIGGCDVMIEMYQSGELQEMLEVASAS